MQLSEVMEQLRDAQEHIRQLKDDKSEKTNLQKTQLATAEEEVKQLKHDQTNMATTVASLQAELEEACAREDKLKVRILLTSLHP